MRPILCLAAALIAAAPAWAQTSAPEWAEYVRVQQAEGRMRTERNPADAPYSNADLIRDFREIMLYSEYVQQDGIYTPGRAAQPLEKRTGPVRLSIVGETLTRTDLVQINDVAARLSRVTGLQVSRDEANPNIQIMVLTRDEMLTEADRLEAVGEEATAYELRHGLTDAICAAYSFGPLDHDGDQAYTIVIPAELTGILRQSCFEEELGQAFGPNADFDGARPSVFNDDEEFSLLTEHDEYLFRMLYDPRLKPGMTERQVMRLLPAILADLRPEGGKTAATMTRRSQK